MPYLLSTKTMINCVAGRRHFGWNEGRKMSSVPLTERRGEISNGDKLLNMKQLVKLIISKLIVLRMSICCF